MNSSGFAQYSDFENASKDKKESPGLQPGQDTALSAGTRGPGEIVIKTGYYWNWVNAQLYPPLAMGQTRTRD
jgi:hypothetical protein